MPVSPSRGMGNCTSSSAPGMRLASGAGGAQAVGEAASSASREQSLPLSASPPGRTLPPAKAPQPKRGAVGEATRAEAAAPTSHAKTPDEKRHIAAAVADSILFRVRTAAARAAPDAGAR